MKRDLLQMLLATLTVVGLLMVSVALYPYETFKDDDTQVTSPREVILASEKRAVPVILRAYDKQQIDRRYRMIASEIDDYRCSLAQDINASAIKTEDKNDTNRTPEQAVKTTEKETNITIPAAPKREQKCEAVRRPRLAIIMDDVHSFENAYEIKKIPFAITPSIFPASSTHPDTPRIAKMFDHYMVHLPMEAFCYDHPEEQTLCITDNTNTIERRIRRVKRDFPRCIALNNHTGSKFTSDPVAMERFFRVLSRYRMQFIDSKTSPRSVAKKIAGRYGLKVRERNIFLDNEPDVRYIRHQLARAVAYAKKHGEAIAICHPRPETFQALMQSQNLLKGVEMVYVNAL